MNKETLKLKDNKERINELLLDAIKTTKHAENIIELLTSGDYIIKYLTRKTEQNENEIHNWYIVFINKNVSIKNYGNWFNEKAFNTKDEWLTESILLTIKRLWFSKEYDFNRQKLIKENIKIFKVWEQKE